MLTQDIIPLSDRHGKGHLTESNDLSKTNGDETSLELSGEAPEEAVSDESIDPPLNPRGPSTPAVDQTSTAQLVERVNALDHVEELALITIDQLIAGLEVAPGFQVSLRVNRVQSRLEQLAELLVAPKNNGAPANVGVLT